MRLSAVMVVSCLALAGPAFASDVPLTQNRQRAPSTYQDDPAAVRAAVIAASAIGGLVVGGFGGYWLGYARGGNYPSLSGALVAMVGAPIGALLGGLGAAALTDSWVPRSPPPVTLIPSTDGRNRASLSLLVRF